MIDARTQRSEELFYAALELKDASERRLLLERECAGDPDLRALVETMLASLAEADRFSGQFAGADPIRGADPVVGSGGRQHCGQPRQPVRPGTDPADWPYKLLQKIGEGGCGVVYMAEQEGTGAAPGGAQGHQARHGHQVRSSPASRPNGRRWRMMDHPNIARVLDAGATETGRPYFVMELVHGIKITDYCDQNNLDTRSGWICSSRFARRSSMRTRKASSIATSSPPTFW